MKEKTKRYWKSFWEILKRPEMGVLPGQLAYFFILSLVPILTLVSYIASFFNISLNDIASYFSLNMDSSIMSILTPIVSNTGFRIGLVIMFLVSIYIISNGTNSIIITANNIYGIKQKSFLERRLKAIIMVFILISLFLFIALVPIFGNFLLSLIERITGYSEIYNVITVFKLPFSWFVIFIFIKILYTIAPDKHIQSVHVNRGAIFTSLGWIIATEIYLYYVKHFAHYSLYFSGLANVAILMIWMYILSTIFVIGLAINNKEDSTDQTIEIPANNNHNNEK